MHDKIKKIFGKKTIYYIESITYIFCIVISVLANVFGPIWIRMIPILFILGVLGKIVFDRPVVTTIFGSIVSICAIRLNGVTSILDNLINTGIFTLYIALGEFCGSKIEEVYKNYIKSRAKRDKKYTLNVIFAIVTAVVCTLLHNYTDSNFFMYNECKDRLTQYLSSTYPNEDFDITNAKYNFESENCFKFNIKNKQTDDNYKFIVYLDEKLDIYDGIIESEKSKEETEFLQKINTIIEGKYEYIQKSVNKVDEGYEINFKKNVDEIVDTTVLDFSNEVSEMLDLIIQTDFLNEIENVNISLINDRNKTDNRISTIYLENYIKNKEEGMQKGYTYIMKSLNIEYID